MKKPARGGVKHLSTVCTGQYLFLGSQILLPKGLQFLSIICASPLVYPQLQIEESSRHSFMISGSCVGEYWSSISAYARCKPRLKDTPSFSKASLSEVSNLKYLRHRHHHDNRVVRLERFGKLGEAAASGHFMGHDSCWNDKPAAEALAPPLRAPAARQIQPSRAAMDTLRGTTPKRRKLRSWLEFKHS